MSYEYLLKEIGFERKSMLPFSDAQSPTELIDRLLAAGQTVAAIQCMAHFLPPRESVWWACQAIREHAFDGLDELDRKCVDIAEAWAMTPTEENRLQAAELAERCGFGTMPGMLALAARYATGSMVPGTDINLPPPERLYAKMSGASVLLAMLKRAPDTVPFVQSVLEAGRKVLQATARATP
jgi:hypothetical protein